MLHGLEPLRHSRALLLLLPIASSAAAALPRLAADGGGDASAGGNALVTVRFAFLDGKGAEVGGVPDVSDHPKRDRGDAAPASAASAAAPVHALVRRATRIRVAT